MKEVHKMRRPTNYTEEEIQYALKCYARGDRAEDIAEATGISQKSIYMQAHRRGTKRTARKYQTFTTEERQKAMRIYKICTAKVASEQTGIPVSTIRRWAETLDLEKLKVEPQTSSAQIAKVKEYLMKKHNTLRLSHKQAFDEIGTFERGRDLGRAIGTGLLPSTGVTDVARYIVLYT